MVLFLNYKTTVVTDEKTKSKKARGGKRVMYATHHPAWDAKNRFGLDDELDMDFDSIRQCFVEPPKAPDIYTQIRTKLEEGGVKEKKVMEYLHEKDPNLREDAVALEMLPPKYLKALNNSISKIINILKED